MREELLTTKDYFRCSELMLICTLAHFGIHTECYERDAKNPERVIAIFRRTEDLDDVCERFWKRQLVVEPISFWQIVREIKARMKNHE